MYVSFKVGYGIKDVVTGGVEGEFSVVSTIKKTKETSVNAMLQNNSAQNTGDVKSANYTAYWFGTNGNAANDCYWVPKKRIGYGDQPFFITYVASNIQRK
jgi:hypothetical protein